jgi:hypothetical protein
MRTVDANEEKSNAEQNKAMAMAAAKIKKEKLLKATADQRAKQSSEVTLTREQIQRANGMLSRAQQQLDEEHDDVKDMNMKMMFSKVITIRDKQL